MDVTKPQHKDDPELLRPWGNGIARIMVPRERPQADGTARFKTQDGRQYVRDKNGSIRRVTYGSSD